MKTNTTDQWTLKEDLKFEEGQDVDRTVWQSPQYTKKHNASYFGQTAIRNTPDFGSPLGCVPVINGAAQLYLSSWNPLSSSNASFLGAQISTIKKWGLASYDAVAFETQVVLPTGTAPDGVVASLFAYNLISNNPFLHDEIDFEIASKYWQGSSEAVNTNVYVVTDKNMLNYDKVVDTNLSLSGTVVLRIEWSAAGVSWYINPAVNTTPFYTETKVPQTDMSLVLNFWVPSSGWSWAYNSSLLPGNAPGTTWAYQVNWAKVWVKPKKK